MDFDFVKHKDCNSDDILSICKLKEQHWDYDIAEQKRWIETNMNNDDVHLLLKNQNELIGYLSMTNVSMKLDDRISNVVGIGSVCVKKDLKGEKIGFLIMQLANYYLSKGNLLGALLCKKDLKDFYIKCGWKIYSNQVTINDEPFNHLLLFSRKIDTKTVDINKTF